MTTALFSVAGAVALIASVFVVTSRRIVHAALWLVVALGAVAGCFGVLHAEFVALVQILVYVGAIVVLVLFALMLTKAPTNPLPGLTTGRSPFAAVVAGVLAILLGGVQAWIVERTDTPLRSLVMIVSIVSLGIPSDRLRTVSYGKEFPFDPGHDEAAFAKNRRAHFVITAK